MSASLAEVKQILVSGMPPGLEVLWDYYGPSVVSRIFTGLAAGHKATAHDFLERLQREVNPLSIVDDIPDWERQLALTKSATALFGTLDQRRAQVLSALRQSGEANFSNIRAIVAPFFNYKDPRQIEIIEADRAQLRAAHTYAATQTLTNIVAGSGAVEFLVPDDGPVSPAGVWLTIEISTPFLDLVTVALRSPVASTLASWSSLGMGSVSHASFQFASRAFLDLPCSDVFGAPGRWRLTMANLGLGQPFSLHSASLFVEAQGKNVRGGEGLGGAVHTWTVVFDPSLVARGASYDLAGALLAIRRIQPAHTQGLLSVVSGGQLFAIPDTDTAIPDAGIPD